jgi:hypothetical protein
VGADPAVERRVLAQLTVREPRAAADGRRERTAAQQLDRQPNTVTQPPPVGLRGQVAVLQARLAVRIGGDQAQPPPALLGLQPDADDELISVRAGRAAGDPAERDKPRKDLDVARHRGARGADVQDAVQREPPAR